MLRQGDILLKPVKELPKEAKKKKDNVVAYGEITGHSHRIENGGVYELTEKLFVVSGGMAEIIHEEHKPLIIEKGIYEVWNEREYDYFDADIRKVLD